MIELSIEALTNMEESPLFLRFVSLLIDDTNNMMGHGMKSLQEIRTLEIKQQQADGLTEDEEKELERLYRAGRSYVALSAETLNLFGYMSEGCYKLMCDETLVTRIAEMANYFLDLLVGKKRKTLKVSLGNT